MAHHIDATQYETQQQPEVRAPVYCPDCGSLSGHSTRPDVQHVCSDCRRLDAKLAPVLQKLDELWGALSWLQQIVREAR